MYHQSTLALAESARNKQGTAATVFPEPHATRDARAHLLLPELIEGLHIACPYTAMSTSPPTANR
jgi:hypothetical protein